MTNPTPEIIEKARTAKSADELIALAKENGLELTEEEAKIFFSQLSTTSGELSDEELDNVAGGGCGGGSSLREEDLPSGTHVMLQGVYRCWNIPDTDDRVTEIGRVRDGCNATYFTVTQFFAKLEFVRLRCPDCYRALSVPYSQIKRI